MSKQTEVKTGAKRLPANAAILALATDTAQARGCRWDEDNANLILCVVDEPVEFIIDDVHDDDSTATVIPFETGRDFRVRLDGTLTGALALGKYVKVDDGGAGLFDLGGAASDVNVARVEDAAGAGGLALVRPLPTGTVTT